MTEPASDQHTADMATPTVTLVPIDDEGRFAVLAETLTDARHAVDAFTNLSTQEVTGGRARHYTIAGGAGAALQGLGSLGAAALNLQGTVQLAPETLRLLAIPGNHLMQSGGQALGTVVNANGQIVANAAFVGTTAATQIATLASSAGMSIALAAIQLQLARIEKALGNLTDLVRDFAEEERDHRSADIEVRIERIVREASLAVEAGEVPAGVLEELRGDAHALEAFSRGAARTLARRARQLQADGKADTQSSRLQRDAYALARDLINSIAAADCLYAYEVMRAATTTQHHPSPVTDFYTDRMLRDAAARADSLRAEAAKTARDLQRRLRQIEARPGSGLRPARRARAKDLATQVAETVATIAPEPPALDIPKVTGLGPAEADQLRQELRWIPALTQVHALYGALAPRLATGPSALRQVADAVSSREAFIAITPGRVLVGHTKDFTSTGTLTTDISADDCDVRPTAEDDDTLTIHTPDDEIQLRPRAEQRALSPSWLARELRIAIATARRPKPPLQITAIAWTPAPASSTEQPARPTA